MKILVLCDRFPYPLENGQNLNPKLETIGRYAGALGLEVGITISDPAP